ncbi:hypothetical protein HanRHA438_Chr01g0028491 [Helianthus annuus]|nr:hypothetical protein HanRHA438_Chr01g0028491 [Helianthus annuus]
MLFNYLISIEIKNGLVVVNQTIDEFRCGRRPTKRQDEKIIIKLIIKNCVILIRQ